MNADWQRASQSGAGFSSRMSMLWLFAAGLAGLLVPVLYVTVDLSKQPSSPNTEVKQEDSRKAEALRPKQIPRVQILKPQRRDMTYAVRLPATLSPIAQVTLYAKVSGYLKWIAVDKGDLVAAGQVLAVLDAPELEQRYKQAHSTYMIKKVTYERLRNVWKENRDVIAKQDVDVAEAAYLGAKHALNQSAAELDYTKVRAPFSGMITARFVDSGALIQAATSSATQTMPLFTLMDMSSFRVYANVSQKDVAYVEPGVRASIKITELPGKDVQGRVTRTTGALDPTTRTMLVEIHIPNEERRLQPGMFATATLYLKEHKNALTIPPAAIVSGNDGEGDSVFVVDQGKARRVSIKTDIDDGVWVEVAQGLTGDEDVVVVGTSGLTDGQSIQAFPYTLPAGKPASQKL